MKIKIKWYEVLLHFVIIVLLIVCIVWVLTEFGKNAWTLRLLKNQCIADCIKFNAEAVKLGLKEVCAC
jgi:hypothetical protein